MLQHVLTDGLHVLSGIKTDIEISMHWGDEQTTATIILMDGIRYVMYDDPEDGWRSSGRLYQVNDELEEYLDKKSVKKLQEETLYPIPDEKVKVQYREEHKGYDNDNEYYEFCNAETGELILRIGTENYNDWYPCAVFSYNPENLSCNKAGNSLLSVQPVAEGTVMPYNDIVEFINEQQKHGPYIAVTDKLLCMPLNIYFTNDGELYADFCTTKLTTYSFCDLTKMKWQDGTVCGIMKQC